MLQVAFGQSKYYSDNLKQNVERGMRQKLRRGEWLTRAPFGYVNNPITRNIEPDPVKSKIIVRAFGEYVKGAHTLISLSQFLADHGVWYAPRLLDNLFLLTHIVFDFVLARNRERCVSADCCNNKLIYKFRQSTLQANQSG